MDEEYTPTLRTLRVAWVASAAPESTAEVHRLQAMFDRAVAAHDREVVAKALRDAAEVVSRKSPEAWERAYPDSYLEDLADRIERGE